MWLDLSGNLNEEASSLGKTENEPNLIFGFETVSSGFIKR